MKKGSMINSTFIRYSVKRICWVHIHAKSRRQTLRAIITHPPADGKINEFRKMVKETDHQRCWEEMPFCTWKNEIGRRAQSKFCNQIQNISGLIQLMRSRLKKNIFKISFIYYVCYSLLFLH